MMFRKMLGGLCFWVLCIRAEYQELVYTPYVDKVEGVDLIKSITVTEHRIDVEVNNEFKRRYLNADFFVEYEGAINLLSLDISIQSLPFLLAIVPWVWMSHGTWFVPVMDETLYVSLCRLKFWYKKMYPEISWDGDLVPRQLVSNSSRSSFVERDDHRAILFNGGFESKNLALSLWEKQLLLISIVDVSFPRAVLFEELAKRWGHEVMIIRSNAFSFVVEDKLDHVNTMVRTTCAFGLASPVLYYKGYSELAVSVDKIKVSSLHLLATMSVLFAEDFRIVQHPLKTSRAEKIADIIDRVKAGDLPVPDLTGCEECRVQSPANCIHFFATAYMLSILGEDPCDYGFLGSFEEIVQSIRQYIWYTHDDGLLTMLEELQNVLVKRKISSEELAWIKEYDEGDRFTRRILREFIEAESNDRRLK